MRTAVIRSNIIGSQICGDIQIQYVISMATNKPESWFILLALKLIPDDFVEIFLTPSMKILFLGGRKNLQI